MTVSPQLEWMNVLKGKNYVFVTVWSLAPGPGSSIPKCVMYWKLIQLGEVYVPHKEEIREIFTPKDRIWAGALTKAGEEGRGILSRRNHVSRALDWFWNSLYRAADWTSSILCDKGRTPFHTDTGKGWWGQDPALWLPEMSCHFWNSLGAVLRHRVSSVMLMARGWNK